MSRRASRNGMTGARFAKRGLRFDSGKTRGADPQANEALRDLMRARWAAEREQLRLAIA